MVIKTAEAYMFFKRKRKDGKIFRPHEKIRFLPNSVTNWVSKPDLLMYNRMRYNCFYIDAVVDNKPPLMNPNKYIKVSRLRGDVDRLQQIDEQNKALIKRINWVNRNGGKVDSYNPLAYASCSKWDAYLTKMSYMTKQNLFIYKRLQNVESKYPKSVLDEEWKYNLNKLKHMAKYTLQMFLTKSVDQTVNEMPSISNLEQVDQDSKRKRPRCYFDFKIKDGISMGRIIIELYNDVCPKTCENFLSICKGNKGLHYKSCKVYNVVKGQYLEMGDITLNNGRGGCSIYGDRFLEEEHRLKHSKPGVVSMVPIDTMYNNSKFSITFEAQERLDSKRVAFGRVIKGMKTIYHIQDLRKKVGSPIVPIFIEKCGQIKKRNIK
ncbi:uncharacterized protein [Onthophagus taurus]|uniref:uncharacterized protein isoform X2 n=1 Tax=Onthophagus taurus TaxID=166361 RepID=UPI0039BE6C93